MKNPKVKQNKLTVLFPYPKEVEEIKKAIKKINDEAGHGVDLKQSTFIRNSTLEKAREINRGK